MLSRRSFMTVGLGLIAGCSTTKSFAGPDDVSTTAAATDTTNGPREPITITSVAMVGDSITAASAGELRDALADIGVDEVQIDGEASRRVLVGSGRNGGSLSGVKAVEALLDDGADPSAWVIALGTNDVGGFGSADEGRELIKQITEMLPPTVPLVWVNVYRPSDLRATRLFNELLAGVLESRGNAIVADWYAIATDPELDVLRSDDLHPNDEGQVAFAELVVQALQRL